MPRIALLALVVFAASAFAATRFNTADDRALKAFQLTTENVRKAAAATRQIAGEAAKDPALARAVEKRGQHADSIDAKAKALESDPRIKSALREQSITAREYVMVQIAALQAGMIAAMKAQGVEIDPSKIAEAMNPANVEFLESHPQEMDALRRSQQALQYPAKRGDPDSEAK